LFQILAPGAEVVYLVGSFNGWAESDGFTVADPTAKMLGPMEGGLFQMFVPLTPGRHLFKFCVNGTREGWILGHPSLPTMQDDFDRSEGQQHLQASSMFEFSLKEPPWPSIVTAEQMSPRVEYYNNRPWLSVRFYSRTAQSAFIVGSWDGWQGISYRRVSDPTKSMKQVENYPVLWLGHIPLSGPGDLQYKIVPNGKEWLSDPSVVELSEDGNTRMTIVDSNGKLEAIFTRRFQDDVERVPVEYRWSLDVPWQIERQRGFELAMQHKARMIWVITMPGSTISETLMSSLHKDPETVAMLQQMICLETPANLVRDVLQQQGIHRVPHVVLINSQFQAVYQDFNPSPEELKNLLRQLP